MNLNTTVKEIAIYNSVALASRLSRGSPFCECKVV